MEKGENSIKIDWWQEIKAIAPTILALSAVFLSWWTFEKLLPLSQSNIVFSESSITITPNQVSEETPEKGPFDAITFSAKNTGKATAKDLTFQVYALPLRKEDYAANNKKVERLFSKTLIHNLDPDSSVTLGVAQVFYNVVTSSGQPVDWSKLSVEYKRMVLVFCLAYHDTLKEVKSEQKIYYFFYVVGKPGVYSLVDDYYTKVYPRLLDQLKEENDTICPTEDVKEKVTIRKLFPKVFQRREKLNNLLIQSEDFSKWFTESLQFRPLFLGN